MEGEQYTAVIVNTLVSRYPSLAPLGDEIRRACEMLIGTFADGKKTLICGNGGSAADADHIVGELMKGFVSRRAVPQELRAKLIAQDTEMGGRVAESLQMGLPAIALTQHAALLTAFANDVNPASVFAQQVLGYGVEGDMFWGISTSGNSKNVVYAAITARALGLKVIGMTGSGGGALAKYSDICLSVPEQETYKVQELHLPIYHAICLATEHAFFPTPSGDAFRSVKN